MQRIESYARAHTVSSDRATDLLWVTYRWMSLGLALTGAVAWLIAHSPAALSLILGNRLGLIVLVIAQMGLVFTFNSVARRVSTAAAAAMFFTYAALTGVTFSVLFVIYTSQSIALTFFLTAGTFGALSVFGATTKKDLSAIGRFAIFALIGLILATVVNFFLRSTPLMWVTTSAGVLIFAALTAYDTQKLLQVYRYAGAAGNLPLIGALTLYLDFINMFLFLLRAFGQRRD